MRLTLERVEHAAEGGRRPRNHNSTMVTFGFSLLGLSETLSVVAIFVAGLLVIPALFLLSEWRETRRTRRFERDAANEMTYADGRRVGGLVFCDYVHEQKLASIAKQKGMEPEPSRRELGTTTTRGGDLGASARGLLARIRREHRRDQREWFDVEKDPNDVLRAVLERLERDGDVDRTVGHTPSLGLDNRTIERLRESTQDESVDDLRERLIVAEKRRELEGVVERSPFVIIESDWRVDVTGAAVSMALKTLRPAYLAHDGYGHGPDPDVATTAVPLPSELSISATFPADGLADKVTTRLTNGATVRAGVLATIATYRDGRLELAPIAVFGRHGALRESVGVGC